MAAEDRIASDALADRLIRVFERADRQLRALLVQAIVSGAMHTANYRLRQSNKVEAILASLRAQVVPLAAAAALGAYTNGIAIVDADLPPELRDRPGFPGRMRPALLFSSRLQIAAIAASDRCGRSIADLFAEIGREEVAVGVASGSGRREVSAAMRERLLRQGMTAFVDRAGRRWGLAQYTRMVARTTTREAVSAGAVTRLDELGIDLVEISSHADPCKVCVPYDGETFSLRGRTEGYPVLDRLPPIHPNCRHVLTAAPLFPDVPQAAVPAAA